MWSIDSSCSLLRKHLFTKDYPLLAANLKSFPQDASQAKYSTFVEAHQFQTTITGND